MSVVVSVPGGGRWPLRHGQDPVDLLAEHGWTGEPVAAALDADGRIEVRYAGSRLAEPGAPVEVVDGHEEARVHQRVGAYAIVVDEGRLLMSRLAGWVPGGGGMWSLPGGGIDPGEEPLDAVVRECHEETGQHVVVGDLLQLQSRRWSDAGEDFHALRLVYAAQCPEPSPARVVEVDGSTGEAAWVPLGEVAGLPLASMIGMAGPHLPEDLRSIG